MISLDTAAPADAGMEICWTSARMTVALLSYTSNRFGPNSTVFAMRCSYRTGLAAGPVTQYVSSVLAPPDTWISGEKEVGRDSTFRLFCDNDPTYSDKEKGYSTFRLFSSPALYHHYCASLVVCIICYGNSNMCRIIGTTFSQNRRSVL